MQSGFNKEGLRVFNKKEDLEGWLRSFNYHDTNLVLMSSGNYDGADILTFANLITKKLRSVHQYL